jgi:flagellar capping protein FliD
MAQDFYAEFNVGPDDKHISTIDESGVALAAIQGLNKKLKEKDDKIAAMEKRLAALEELVKGFPRK